MTPERRCTRDGCARLVWRDSLCWWCHPEALDACDWHCVGAVRTLAAEYARCPRRSRPYVVFETSGQRPRPPAPRLRDSAAPSRRSLLGGGQ